MSSAAVAVAHEIIAQNFKSESALILMKFNMMIN